MTRSKLHFLLIVFLLSLVLSSCAPTVNAEEPDLQATLAALYAEETAQAALAEPPAQPAAEQPAETPPTEEAAPAGPSASRRTAG